MFRHLLLPREPDNIVFDDLEGVLAEVGVEGLSGTNPWAGEW